MTTELRTSNTRAALALGLALLTGGCAASTAFKKGEEAVKAGNYDQAVAYFRTASQDDPDNANYSIALQRAMQSSSREHFVKAQEFEKQDQLESALGEYTLAGEFDPSNRTAGSKVAEINRTLRARAEASRPRPFADLQARARALANTPALINAGSKEPLGITINSARPPDAISAVANAGGINVTFDSDVNSSVGNRTVTLQADLTFEQALNQIMLQSGLAYKILTDRAIFVFPDTQPKHALYDDQVIQTFPISHADLQQLTQIVTALIRLQGAAGGVQPIIQPNVANRTLVVKTTIPMMQIVERIIQQNDKPPAEVVVDVEILEVNRTRAKTYGLSLSEYAIGGVFSPEVSPNGRNVITQPATGTAGATTPTNGSTTPSQIVAGPPFNLNTISRGFTNSDFYLAVPTAIVRFLESDSQTKLIAKPQLRGTEGQKLTLRLGESTPVPSTTFTPLAAGGASTNPLTSFNYRDVGVNLDITPTVTLDGDIIMDLTVENSSVGRDVLVNGVTAPSFGQRTVTTRLRLRDGESNLLAGLLREDERKSLQGFPGAIHVPILKQLFSANDNQVTQTDIVMLLTPHIVRPKGDYTPEDLAPIYIGSGQNVGLNGPPPLIATAETAPVVSPAAPAATAAPVPTNAIPGPGGVLVAPPAGSSPIPGTVTVAPSPSPAQGTTPPPPVNTSPSPSPIGPQPTPQPVTPQPVTPAPITPQPVTPQPTPPGAQAAAQDVTPITTSGLGGAQVTLSPPGSTFRVGGGPYTVPLTISNAVRLTTISITITFDPARLRVRSVQEGSFMRSGGVNTTFMQQVGNGRVDLTITRASDATGASGTGLLSAILFDPVSAGTVSVGISGVASGPGGTSMSLQLRPVTLTIQP